MDNGFIADKSDKNSSCGPLGWIQSDYNSSQ